MASSGKRAPRISITARSTARSNSVTRSMPLCLRSIRCAWPRPRVEIPAASSAAAWAASRAAASQSSTPLLEVAHHGRRALDVEAELARLEDAGVDHRALDLLEAELLGEEVAGVLGDEEAAPAAA